MRINKYIAMSGIASRRKAEELIVNGNVKVDGKTVTTLAFQVDDGQQVTVNGREIKLNRNFKYYLLNKPVGYVTTLKDEKSRPTVMELIDDSKGMFPVGRLDMNTSGLLLITNDGHLAQKMTHPKYHMDKTYRVLARGIISKERIRRLSGGIDIGGYVTRPAKVKLLRIKGHDSLLEITISEGKNRQIRKMMRAVGNPVKALERVAIGNIRLGHTLAGHYRNLTREEVKYLKDYK